MWEREGERGREGEGEGEHSVGGRPGGQARARQAALSGSSWRAPGGAAVVDCCRLQIPSDV